MTPLAERIATEFVARANPLLELLKDEAPYIREDLDRVSPEGHAFEAMGSGSFKVGPWVQEKIGISRKYGFDIVFTSWKQTFVEQGLLYGNPSWKVNLIVYAKGASGEENKVRWVVQSTTRKEVRFEYNYDATHGITVPLAVLNAVKDLSNTIQAETVRRRGQYR